AYSFAIDLTPPSIGLSPLGGGDNTISSRADDRLLAGVGEPNQPLQLSITGPTSSLNLPTITSDAAGAFRYAFTDNDLSLLGQGSSFTLTISQRDAAGNSTTITSSFAIDTVAPAAAVIRSAGGADKTISTALADQAISGSAEPGSLVAITLIDTKGSSQTLGSTLANAAGDFSLLLSPAQLGALPQGSGLQLLGQISDAAGNSSTSSAFTISIDTVALPAPTLTAGGADAILTSLTGDASLTGTATPYATVQLEAESLSLGTATANGRGLFSFALSPAHIAQLGQGLQRFWASITDDAGNVSRSSATLASIDTEADQAPTLISAGGSDGVISSLSGDQQIVGRDAAPARPVTLATERSTLLLGTVTPDATGAFRYTLTNRNLQDLGQLSGIELIASQPDALGNVGRSQALTVAIDTLAPDAPLISSIGGADSVITNQITGDGPDTTVLGTASPGSLVGLWGSDDGISYRFLATTTANADGRFQYVLSSSNLSSFQQGSGRFLQARLSDAAGNSSSSTPFQFSLETAAPAAPTFAGLSGSGSLTYNAAASTAGGLLVSGRAPGASEVELRLGEGRSATTISPRASVTSSGGWSVWLTADQLPSSATGTTTPISITALNRHGDRSEATATTLNVDTTAPKLVDAIQEGGRIR
ncbi:MAG: hypothetical protein EBZ51_11605, partial [Synechococcaceae bacterium WB9_2_112]|nr:hypothetical protein [Synechococcaceae bacterium WB9_2_112]